MQLNRCGRCGSFFMANGDVCPNCQPKDLYEISRLKNFLEDASPNSSIEEIELGG